MSLTGLFSRGSSYYLRVMLPAEHPATATYRSGKVVLSLGARSHRDAVAKGTLLRAEVLRDTYFAGTSGSIKAPVPTAWQADQAVATVPALPTTQTGSHRLRFVFDQWVEAKPRSADSASACRRALEMYEAQTGNPHLGGLTRAMGVGFRAWLLHPSRKTASKTARDRLTWVKSLLKFAYLDLELIPRHPWEGLDIEHDTSAARRPWSPEELELLFRQPLHTGYQLPADKKSGGEAAYWVPLLGLFTGARISELVQLRIADVQVIAGVTFLSITDEGAGKTVKTAAARRLVPVHSELVRLGFLAYVQHRAMSAAAYAPLWPTMPLRAGKPGGYFSQWFGSYRRAFGLGTYPDFHCFRHTVRTVLASANISEPVIDLLVGHEVKGSTGAKVYTHTASAQLRMAIESLRYPGLQLPRLYPVDPPLQ